MSRDHAKEEIKDHTVAVCATCHRPFYRDEDWKITCLICFKTERNYDLYAGDKQMLLLQDAMHDLTEKLREHANDAETWKRRAIKEKKKKTPITKSQLKDLIRLCHPDKHQGNKKATEITQWLISLRDED
jgi:hypothetical protein